MCTIEASYHVWNRSTHAPIKFLYCVRQICCLFSVVVFSEKTWLHIIQHIFIAVITACSQSLMGGLSRDPASISFLSLLCSLLESWRGGLRNEEATWWAQRRQIRGMCCRVTGKNLCGCGTVGFAMSRQKFRAPGGWCPRWGRYGGGRRLGMNSSI